MTAKEKLLSALKTTCIKYIFGYNGGASMPLFYELENFKDLQFIM